jgi:signal transduction histidine kinase
MMHEEHADYPERQTFLPPAEMLGLGARIRAGAAPEALLQEVAETIHHITSCPHIVIRLLQPAARLLHAVAFVGIDAAQAAHLRSRPVTLADCKALLQERFQVSDSFLVPAETLIAMGHADEVPAHINADTGTDTEPPDPHHVRAASMLLVPVYGRETRLLALMSIAVPLHLRTLILPHIHVFEAIAHQAGLALENAHLAAQVQHRVDQLAVLTALARIATSTLDMKQMLTEVTECICQGFGYSHVELYLLDDAADELVLYAHVSQAAPLPPGRRQSTSLGILGRTVRAGLAQQIDDVQQEQDYHPGIASTRSELCVPIMAGGRVLGLINLESETVAAFTTEDVAVLTTAADILAGALENARLYRRAQEAAVLEERNRLARDLHDSVTQQLFSITLMAQAARTHMARDQQRATTQVERLHETAVAALAEMRALIFQLRPPALADNGLVTALQQHIATLSRREGLRIELSVTGSERYARGFEQALYRIVQEGLNNIVKHAHASNARVRLEFDVRQLQVSIIDDGAGFDVHALPAGGQHFGLTSMRERAAELGGSLTIQSAPGSGTEISLRVARSEDITR